MSDGDPLDLVAEDGDAGVRLDRFLADPLGSRARAQSLIETGAVTVDGRRVLKRHALNVGERILVRLPSPALTAVAEGSPDRGASYAVAWEDEHLLVVDKPAGVVTHPARGHRTGTLAQALAGRGADGGEDPARAGIVHRLDRDTSGLLVVARSDTVLRALRAQLAGRALRREYRALVAGHPRARTGTIEAPIGRDRRTRTRMSIDTDEPREARTHFAIERLLPDTALLQVLLDTGRTHQIRVHLAAISLPVVGDPQYGVAGAESFGLTRQFLHAARIAFTHPVTGEAIDVASELPDDLQRALHRAGG